MAIKKAELQAGMIVWLRKPLGNYDPRLPNDHHGANNEYGVLGIDLDGCGRPVVILDMMPENEHRVWACTVSLPSQDVFWFSHSKLIFSCS